MDNYQRLLVRNAELETELRFTREQLTQANDANRYLLGRMTAESRDRQADQNGYPTYGPSTRAPREQAILDRPSDLQTIHLPPAIAQPRAPLHQSYRSLALKDVPHDDVRQRHESVTASVKESPALSLIDFDQEDAVTLKPVNEEPDSGKSSPKREPSVGLGLSNCQHAGQEQDENSATRPSGFNITQADGSFTFVPTPPTGTGDTFARDPTPLPPPSRRVVWFSDGEHMRLFNSALFLEDMTDAEQAEHWLKVAKEDRYRSHTAAEYKVYYEDVIRPAYLEKMAKREARQKEVEVTPVQTSNETTTTVKDQDEEVFGPVVSSVVKEQESKPNEHESSNVISFSTTTTEGDNKVFTPQGASFCTEYTEDSESELADCFHTPPEHGESESDAETLKGDSSVTEVSAAEAPVTETAQVETPAAELDLLGTPVVEMAAEDEEAIRTPPTGTLARAYDRRFGEDRFQEEHSGEDRFREDRRQGDRFREDRRPNRAYNSYGTSSEYRPLPPPDPYPRRTVIIQDIPQDATLADVLSQIKGGKIVTASYFHTAGMKTTPPLETNAAMVIFLKGLQAQKFMKNCPFSNAMLWDSPSPSIDRRLLRAVHDYDLTRIFFIHGGSPNWTPQSVTSDLRRFDNFIQEPLTVGVDDDGIMTFEFASMAEASAAWYVVDRACMFGGVSKGFLRDPCDRPVERVRRGEGEVPEGEVPEEEVPEEEVPEGEVAADGAESDEIVLDV